jgi:hypothetical protein
MRSRRAASTDRQLWRALVVAIVVAALTSFARCLHPRPPLPSQSFAGGELRFFVGCAL